MWLTEVEVRHTSEMIGKSVENVNSTYGPLTFEIAISNGVCFRDKICLIKYLAEFRSGKPVLQSKVLTGHRQAKFCFLSASVESLHGRKGVDASAFNDPAEVDILIRTVRHG